MILFVFGLCAMVGGVLGVSCHVFHVEEFRARN